ncbi:MAG TPA: hypothetical protein VMU00_09200 [Steroidobacteraceae bacterium]|nr:hypothetical protein [Steroidobacteraceae bacterium]
MAMLSLLGVLATVPPPAAGAAAAPVPVPVTVAFSAALDERLATRYGEAEREALRSYVVESLRHALARRARAVPLPADARAEVLLADAQPSHPTRRQLLDNPSIDPLRSRSLGGADLSGTIRAADGRVLATVRYDYYPVDLAVASPGGDPWADARIAIERFATQLAARLQPVP